MKYANRLKEFKKMKGITLEQVAELLGKKCEDRRLYQIYSLVKLRVNYRHTSLLMGQFVKSNLLDNQND